MAKYINADKLKDKIFELAEDDYCTPLDEYIDGLRQRTEGILDIIDEMPSADVVKVKHGEWIRLPDGWDGIDEYERYKCSVCNQLNSWGDTPFCRWCGADMRKRRKSDGRA